MSSLLSVPVKDSHDRVKRLSVRHKIPGQAPCLPHALGPSRSVWKKWVTEGPVLRDSPSGYSLKWARFTHQFPGYQQGTTDHQVDEEIDPLGGGDQDR